MQVVENLFKNAYGEKLIYVVGTHQNYFQSYVTENKEENYLEIHLFQVSCPLSFLF